MGVWWFKGSVERSRSLGFAGFKLQGLAFRLLFEGPSNVCREDSVGLYRFRADRFRELQSADMDMEVTAPNARNPNL